MKKQKPKTDASKEGPKSPPSVIQLPGGITVRARDFRITSVDADGRPKTFELARGNESSDCVLWAADVFLDGKLPDYLEKRMRDRIEASIEGPNATYVTESRDIEGGVLMKSRAHGVSKLSVGVDHGYSTEGKKL